MARKKKRQHPSVKGAAVFVKWFRHWRTGRRVYPVRAKAIRFIPKKPKAA